jgi:glutaminyl-tRNA synthetase
MLSANSRADSQSNCRHSLCTLEFVDARPAYEWLCDSLEVYKPRQYETARLSLQGTFLSKRKIKKLVDGGHVSGWDDPRLFTLIALRRRGIPPAAMLRFVAEVGVSTSISETRLNRFEQSIRQTLEMSAARLSLVLEPVKLTIENVSDEWEAEVEKFLHPKVPEMGKIKAICRKHSYIERDDFRITPPADFNRLSPGKSVILMGSPFPVTCTDVKTDVDGNVIEIITQLEDGTGPNKDKKFKGKDASAIHWVNVRDAVAVDEVRFFEPLFKSDDPSKVDDFEADINPESLKVYRGAFIEPAFFGLAKKLINEAKEDAEVRTKNAATFSQSRVEAGPAEVAQGVNNADVATHIPATDDDTPVATASQLVGLECIRFQGMRLAYFAVDKESVIGCLSEDADVEAGQRPGDKIILNKIVSLKEEKGKKAT